jgi:hypothetical protein
MLGAMARIAPPQPNEAMARIAPPLLSAAAQRQTTKFGSPAKRFFPSASPPYLQNPATTKKTRLQKFKFSRFLIYF